MRLWKKHIVTCACLLLLLPGCGIITLPFQLVGVALVNRPWHIEGTLADDAGNPVQNVHLKIHKQFWGIDLLYGGTMAGRESFTMHEDYTLRNGYFSAGGFNQSAYLTFSSPGHYDRTLMLIAGDTKNWDLGLAGDLFSSGVAGPPAFTLTPYSLRLYRKLDPVDLKESFLAFSNACDDDAPFVNLEHPDKTGTIPPPVIDDHLPPNLLVAVFNREPGPTPAADTPLQSIRFICTSPGGGLIRVPAKHGEPLEGMMRTAPDTGYQHDVTVPAADLTEAMTQKNAILFYVKITTPAGPQYGRIRLANGTLPVGISGHLWLAPPSSQNLESPPTHRK